MLIWYVLIAKAKFIESVFWWLTSKENFAYWSRVDFGDELTIAFAKMWLTTIVTSLLFLVAYDKIYGMLHFYGL